MPARRSSDKRGAATKHASDKGWSDLEGFGAESKAKMARMHFDGLWKYDAAHGYRLPHGV